MPSTSGLGDFKALLREFKGFSGWVAAAAVALPFVTSFVNLSPPWPPGIVQATALIEFIGLIIAFQFFYRSSRGKANRAVLVASITVAVAFLAYLIAFSELVFETETTHKSLVKGMACNSDALEVFKERCPFLNLDEISLAGYDPARIWTARSITQSRMILVGLWGLFFLSLSILVGVFVTFQRIQRKTS